MAFFTPAPVFAIIDFSFPTQTVYDANRRPLLEPIYSISVINKPTITKAVFEKGIEQVTSWGENQLAREFQVEFNLPRGDADEVDAFLGLAFLYGKWFFWDAGDVSNGEIKVRCEQWSKNIQAHNRSIIKATFIETFDYAPRNYGFFIYPVSWTTAIKDASSSRGFWLGGSPTSYSIGVQDATLVCERVITGEALTYAVDVLPAGPEIYFLDSDALEYSISTPDATLVVGLGGGGGTGWLELYYDFEPLPYADTSDIWIEWRTETVSASNYFGDMSVQMFGWESLAFIEWWGN